MFKLLSLWSFMWQPQDPYRESAGGQMSEVCSQGFSYKSSDQENQLNLPGGNHTHSMWGPHSWPETPDMAHIAGF